MRDTIYYFEIFATDKEPSKCFYLNDSEHGFTFRRCDRIWKQGPLGGVKVVYEGFFLSDRFKNCSKEDLVYYGYKYVTKNEEAMRRFAWLKLKAQPFVI